MAADFGVYIVKGVARVVGFAEDILAGEVLDLPEFSNEAIHRMCEHLIQVWRYKPGFMHQKALVVDHTMAAIGTTNMDNRSFRLNFENMAVFFDARASASTASMLQKNFERSFLLDKELADQPRHLRVGAPIARLFSLVL